MTFSSKKDWWLTLVFWGTAIVCVVGPLLDREWIAAVFLIPLAVGMLWLWFTTRYIIEEGALIVRYGPFKHVIAISGISNVRRTRNPFASPALSMDRLEVNYAGYGTILISPVDREEFIRQLLKVNPKITVGSPF